MHTILSYGMGVESTALLVAWLSVPSTCPCPLSELIVVSAQTGDEYDDTRRAVETYILPLLRRHNIRYVQVARRGHHQSDGITVLSDSRQPDKLYVEGDYKLSDELRAAGTLPQYAGEHRCSLKFKAWVIETWLADNIVHPSLHAFGYNADETKRVRKSESAMARSVAFGFNADELARIGKAKAYDTPLRKSFYPLVEWGWTRQKCIDYLHAQLGIVWRKSACIFCPFNSLRQDALLRHQEHPEQIANALLLEHVSLSLNPRGTLYRNQSLIDITDASGNRIATNAFQQKLDAAPWTVYHVRRIYSAGKDSSSRPSPTKKGTVLRAVVRLTDNLPRNEAVVYLHRIVTAADEIEVRRGITYLYRHRREISYPTREEFFVASPAVVETKARYGLDWFEQQWDDRQSSLFSLERTA